jgi:hypothetical protein
MKKDKEPEIPLDMRRALITAFKNVGDQEKFDKWAKTHLTLLYSMCMKLVPNVAQVSAQVDTHVTVHNAEEARQKLYDGFMRIIEDRHGDADARRGTDGAGPQPLVTYSRVEDPMPIGAGRATVDAPPSTDDVGRATVDARPSTVDAQPAPRADDTSQKQNPNLDHDGSPLCGGPRQNVTGQAPSATELYYRWMDGAGGARNRWGPI